MTIPLDWRGETLGRRDDIIRNDDVVTFDREGNVVPETQDVGVDGVGVIKS